MNIENLQGRVDTLLPLLPEGLDRSHLATAQRHIDFAQEHPDDALENLVCAEPYIAHVEDGRNRVADMVRAGAKILQDQQIVDAAAAAPNHPTAAPNPVRTAAPQPGHATAARSRRYYGQPQP
jgi:hypothetical protein